MLDDVYTPSKICQRCRHVESSSAELPCYDCTSPEIGHPNNRYEPAPRTKVLFDLLMWLQGQHYDKRYFYALLIVLCLVAIWVSQ